METGVFLERLKGLSSILVGDGIRNRDCPRHGDDLFIVEILVSLGPFDLELYELLKIGFCNSHPHIAVFPVTRTAIGRVVSVAF